MLEVVALMALAAAAPPPATPIEARINARRRSFAGRMGVAAIHLDTGETIAVAADESFPTASAIKTAVMVEVFHQIAAGRIRKDQMLMLTDEMKVGGSGVLHSLRAGGPHSVGDLLYLMIALSDNTATDMLIALVGTRAVDDRVVAYGLPHTRLYRPMFRGGSEGRDPRRFRDRHHAERPLRRRDLPRRTKDTRWTVDNDALVTGAQVSRMVSDHFIKAMNPR